MSNEAFCKAITKKAGGPKRKLLLTTIAEMSGMEGYFSFWLKRICVRTEMKPSKVLALLDEFSEKNWIRRVSEDIDGGTHLIMFANIPDMIGAEDVG